MRNRSLPPSSPTGPSSTGPDLFVGRRAELEVMEQVWTAVTEGHRRVVFIGGEPGIGKSGLAACVASTLERHGATVLWGSSYPDVEVPYRPLVTALETAFRHLGPERTREVVAEDLPLLASLLPSLSETRGSHARTEPTGGSSLPLFDAVSRVLGALSERGPVVLVLEDLHWAGQPTVQMMKHLVRASGDLPLLIVVTHRTTAPDRTATLTHAIADLYALPGVDRLDLSGLSAEDIVDYLMGQVQRPRDEVLTTAAVLRDETDGNPFLLRELWRDAAGSGGEVLTALRGGAVRAPATVRDTIDRRLAHLSSEHREMVELAAVAGQTAELATIAAASGRGPADLLDAVDVAVSAGLLVPIDQRPGVYGFRHALVRQAVLDRLAPSALAHAHAAIARALSGAPVQDADRVERLAHHYESAHALGFVTEAVSYLTRAARHAERSSAHVHAAELYARAAALPAPELADREGLLLAVARSHTRAGDFSATRELAEGLAASTDPVVAVRAAILHEDASWRPSYDGQRSTELLEGALARYPDDTSDPLRIRALASYSRALSFNGRADVALGLGDDALALARTNGDEDLLTHTLACTLWRGLSPANAPVVLARASELAGLAGRRGDDDHLVHAGFYRAMYGYITGDVGAWHAGEDDVATAARRTGEPFARYVDACARYARAFAAGDLTTARALLAELETYTEAFGPHATAGSHGVQSFMVERASGRLGRVARFITGDERTDDHWAPGLLALHLELGLRDAAARVLPVVLASLRRLPTGGAQRAGVLAYAADAAVALASREHAEELRELLAPYEGLNLVLGQFVAVFGAADRYLAMLDGVLDRPNVEERFAAALERDRDMGADLHEVETLRAWARYLDGRGPSAADRAAALREEAETMAGAIGYARPPLGGPPPDTGGRTPLPADLTQRELDVLVLVSAGRSNREIGDELHISPNTAANHVRSILMKTGSPNRTSAAIFAAEHGLLGAS